MPEPIQSATTNMCQLDEPYEMSGNEAPPPAPVTPASPPGQGPEPAPSANAVQQLVGAASPSRPPDCTPEVLDALRTGTKAVAAAAAVWASGPTLFGVVATGALYLEAAAEFGVSVAKLKNCEDEGAATTKAQ